MKAEGILIAVLAMGCGGGGSSSGPAAPSAPAASFNTSGSWTGTSSAGGTVYPITFTVSGSQVTALTVQVGVFHFNSGLQGMNCSTSMNMGGPSSITANAFTAAVSSAMGTATFRGQFSSATTASGTYDAWDIVQGCSGSSIGGLPRQSGGNWSATRQ